MAAQSEKRKAQSWVFKIGAALCALICLVFFGLGAFARIDAWAKTGETADSPISANGDSGKLSDLNDGSPTMVLSHEHDPDEHRFQIAPNAEVIINEEPASISELREGDELIVKKDALGKVTSITATRAQAGILINAHDQNHFTMSPDLVAMQDVTVPADIKELSLGGQPATIADLKPGDDVKVFADRNGKVVRVEASRMNLLQKFWQNFRSNLFKPLLLFFYVGFAVPLLRIAFEFPKAMYQGLTIYLLASIGWHGGEELAVLNETAFRQAVAFMIVGFATNAVIGFLAYMMLRLGVPKLRRIDAATVAGYYGSDSAGTFVTCLGVLQAAHIASAAYMPVILAVMEIPGCLVCLTLAAHMRATGMDKRGNMPGEPGYKEPTPEEKIQMNRNHSIPHLAREIFLNPGLFLLFGGILIGFVSRLQGYKTVQGGDALFVTLFQGLLCLFLLEMGMTAARRLRDLRSGNWTFIAFGLIAPNIFACIGMGVACLLSHALHQPFQLGTYVLFAVLCGASSYIAVPAVQRLAIPEASPSLPLAASLGLTFSYNVTVGIPVYLLVAQQLMRAFPV
jgi:hypothetical protein